MIQLTNEELLNKLETLIKATNKISEEIEAIKCSLTSRIDKVEEGCRKIENKITTIERRNRRNNIVIFGVRASADNLLKVTLDKLNGIFELQLSERDIDNVYIIGIKNTIIVEFVSYLKKLSVLQNCRKLKGTGISIADDLCPEDQKIRTELYGYLKRARANNLNAYVRGQKLYINNIPHTLEELQTNSKQWVNDEDITQASHKTSIIPSTPVLNTTELEKELDNLKAQTQNTQKTELKETLTRTELLPQSSGNHLNTAVNPTNSEQTQIGSTGAKNKEKSRNLRERKPSTKSS